MTGQQRPAPVGLLIAAGLALVAGCTATGPTPARHDRAVPALKLVAFDDCAALLGGLRAAARQSVGLYGLPSDARYAVPAEGSGAEPGPLRAAPDAAKDSTPAHSGTNTHEAGVDEPDLVKTDGRRIVAVNNGTLRVVDAASRRVTGTLAIAPNVAAETNLLLAGDHALVLTATGYDDPLPGTGRIADTDDMFRMRPADAQLVLVDLAGPPRVLGRYTIDGSLVDARQVGSTARVVVRSSPRLPFHLDGDRSQEQRLADNRQVIDSTPVEQWLPGYVVDSGGSRTQGRVDCRAVSRPATYSGMSLLTVLSFDLARPALGNGDPTSLVADGDTVYATATSLYVAVDDRWRYPQTLGGPAVPVPARTDQSTTIYRFDTAGTGRPRYVAGGSVPGWLVNQYAMSEWGGRLRVATSVGAMWGQTGPTESSVYVLDSALRQVGRVGGLGRGERIYAVRFIGATGYVVTFRQTDPLYVVDLRDPASPRVTGELKINGYSSYLHPAGNGRLIGIGQDAGDNGRVTGLQVAVFDVADPAHPTRITRYAMPGAYSQAEYDPHAFLYWPATGLLVVPVTAGTATGGVGALALRLSGASISSAGTVAMSRGVPIDRSLVVGGVLWTVAGPTMTAYDLTNLARLAEV